MKKMLKDIRGFGAANIGLGVSSAVVAKTGVAGAGAGLSTAAGMMPMVGTAMMAKHTMRMVKPKKMRRR